MASITLSSVPEQTMKYRWSIAPSQPVLADFLAKKSGISRLLAQCLLNRGFSEPEPIQRFLQPRLQHLADPFLLPNMRAAVDRLFLAHARREAMVIFGDYDVDGVTSTALLRECLGTLGWKVNHYLPHRMGEGYGLSQGAVENCLKKFPSTLLLAVDCGSTAVATVAWLAEHGVDVIVLDHHQVSRPPPAVVALVNPWMGREPEPGSRESKIEGGEREMALPPAPDPSPLTFKETFHELCSVGLAFKLAHALVKQGRLGGLPGAAEFDLRPYLDLVALGTIADLVPLSGENRILVNSGLERLQQTRRPGLIALKKIAGIDGPVGGYEVGFQLAPRLNAAGRLETAEEALALMLAPDLAAAEPIAHSLDARNRERQKIERSMADRAIETLRNKFNPDTDHVIVEGEALWHIGVVGIVASRVLQEFYRPTLIIGGEGEEWRGSGRSIDGFDLAAALRQCDDLLVRHGGHAMAAGVTIRSNNIDALRARLNDIARRSLRSDQLQRSLRLDAETSPGELTLARLQELQRLQQTGVGNPPVHLLLRNVTHARPLQRIGSEKKHARLWITDERHAVEAVLWNVGDGALPIGRFDLACAPQINEYNDHLSVQLKVLDWRPAE